MFVYCNTEEAPRIVGEVICRANFVEDNKRSWNVSEEGESGTIQINSENRCVAVIYSIDNLLIGVEADDNCVSDIIEPLMKKYGFDNVKWL